MNEFDSYADYQFVDDLVQWVQRRGFGGYMTYNMEAEYLGGIGSIAAQSDAAYPLSTELYNASHGGVCAGAYGGCLSVGPVQEKRRGQLTSQ
jgi:hypothetical protein